MQASLLTSCLALTLVACAVESAEEARQFDDAAAPQSAPPPLPASANAFVVGELYPGLDTPFTWAELPADAVVRVYATRRGTGLGPCPPRLRGDCMDIVGPVREVAAGRADGDGVIAGLLRLPPNAPSGTYTFQAVAYTRATGHLFSRPYARSTGPQFCPFSFVPVCGVDGISYDNDCMAELFGTVVQTFDWCPE